MHLASLGKKLVIVLAVTGLIWLFVVFARAPQQEGEPVIGSQERVLLTTPAGDKVEVIARIDTGAEFSSIDDQFALSLGFQPTSRKVVVITDAGRQERTTIETTFTLDDRSIASVTTLADRSGFPTRMLIGRRDLSGFRIDANREFLTEPAGAPRLSPLPFFPGLVDRIRIEKFIIIIPILGSAVVLMRLFVGFRTYGIFGPVVIALTLIHLDVVQGALIYLLLLVAGVFAQVLLLSRLRLAHLAQFSLTMFVLVLTLVAVSAIPGFFVPFTGAFFPLIITSHLIEQASRTVEEHHFWDAIPILLATMGTAAVLAGYGSFLLNQSYGVLWTIFGVSLLAAIMAGYYLGLRLTEYVRFKFLRKTHEHK